MGNIYIALVHWPVYNREGETVATSVTPLDLHDIGRIALTYGVAGYYVTNPYESQRRLVEEIIYHWREGIGGEHSPQRQRALSGAKVVATAEAAFDDVAALEGVEPFVAATTARRMPGALPTRELADAAGGRPVLLLFGTGYGLTEDLLLAADAALEPIAGRGDFNHLPVRAAVAIYLDRIFNGNVRSETEE
ncbi:MAG: RNA methyltransferase [candidate division Zixibacteria bacterium]|nr:RNA methyltransferase [candidate division Zixibacteria bacterium]